jgi:hypothetical protein
MRVQGLNLRNVHNYILASACITGLFYQGCKSANKTAAEEKSIASVSGINSSQICKGTPSSEFNTLFDSLWKDANDPNDKGSIHAHEGYKPYLREIMSVLPFNLTKWYFGLGGDLTLVSNIETVCSKGFNPSIFVPFNDEEGRLAGCLISTNSPISDAQGTHLTMPEMYVQIRMDAKLNDADNKVLVEKSASQVIKGFALVASYFTTELSKENTSDLIFNSSELADDKLKLAFFYSDDVVNAMKLGLIAQPPQAELNGTFDPGIYDQSLDRNTRYSKFTNATNQSKPEYARFLNDIFAEVLVADLCNDTTRATISQAGTLSSVGMQWYNATRKPLMTELGPERLSAASSNSPADTNNTPVPSPVPSPESLQVPTGNPPSTSLGLNEGSDQAPQAPQSSLELGGGRVLAVLGAVIRFPFAAARFLVENRPVRTFFREHQPIRNTVRFTARVGGTVAAATVQTGRVIVRGSARLIVGAGRLVLGVATLPFRIFRR